MPQSETLGFTVCKHSFVARSHTYFDRRERATAERSVTTIPAKHHDLYEAICTKVEAGRT